MTTLKVLECPKYAKYIGTIPREIEYFASKEIQPVFNRNGWYYDRKNYTSWIEYNGKAWYEDVSMFKYTLDLLDHKPLTDKEIECIKYLAYRKTVKTKKFFNILQKDYEWKDLRTIRREIWGSSNKIINKIKNEVTIR